MRKVTIFPSLLIAAFVVRANAQTINLERTFPVMPSPFQGGPIGDHGTNLDSAAGVEAVIQRVDSDGHSSFDIIDLGTGQIIVSLEWADLSPYLGGGDFGILGFADLDNCGHREVIVAGGSSCGPAQHVLVVDPRTMNVKFHLAPPSPVGSFCGYGVSAIGDLDGDGADEMLVQVASYAPHDTGLLYGSGPPTSVSEGAAFAVAARSSLIIRPNPSRQAIHIALDLPTDRNTSLRIFDASGRLVRAIRPSQGSRDIQWDGLDSVGRQLAAGVYFCEMSSPSGSRATRKLVRIE